MTDEGRPSRAVWIRAGLAFVSFGELLVGAWELKRVTGRLRKLLRSPKRTD
jgi:hypothetical protein